MVSREMQELFDQGISFEEEDWNDLQMQNPVLYEAAHDALNRDKFVFVHKTMRGRYNDQDLTFQRPLYYLKKINGNVVKHVYMQEVGR